MVEDKQLAEHGAKDFLFTVRCEIWQWICWAMGANECSIMAINSIDNS
jgi:hypothetical protein